MCSLRPRACGSLSNFRMWTWLCPHCWYKQLQCSNLYSPTHILAISGFSCVEGPKSLSVCQLYICGQIPPNALFRHVLPTSYRETSVNTKTLRSLGQQCGSRQMLWGPTVVILDRRVNDHRAMRLANHCCKLYMCISSCVSSGCADAASPDNCNTVKDVTAIHYCLLWTACCRALLVSWV